MADWPLQKEFMEEMLVGKLGAIVKRFGADMETLDGVRPAPRGAAESPDAIGARAIIMMSPSLPFAMKKADIRGDAMQAVLDMDELEGARIILSAQKCESRVKRADWSVPLTFGLTLSCQWDEDKDEPFYAALTIRIGDIRFMESPPKPGERLPCVILASIESWEMPAGAEELSEILDEFSRKAFPRLKRAA